MTKRFLTLAALVVGLSFTVARAADEAKPAAPAADAPKPAADAPKPDGKKPHATPEEQFKKLDKDGDGKLTLAEFSAAKKWEKAGADAAKKAFDEIDTDKKGSITLEQFVAAMKAAHKGKGEGKGKPAAPAAGAAPAPEAPKK